MNLILLCLACLLCMNSCMGENVFESNPLKRSMCDGLMEASSCIERTTLGAHTCVYCAKDKQCHDVGSLYDPCSDDCCASESSLSTCKWKNPSDIPEDCFPTKPEQVHIAYHGQTARGYPSGMTVSWFTPLQTDTSVVKYGLSENGLNEAIKGPTALQYLQDHGFHHHVTLKDLEPATTYYYQVGDSDGGFSDVYQFTMPKDDNSEMTVAIFGDMGYLSHDDRGPMIVPAVGGLSKNWTAVPTRDMLKKWNDQGKMDWSLIVGDIGYADDSFAYSLTFAYEETYNGYMNWMQDMAASIPFMVNQGNHETECHSPVCVLESKYHEPLRNYSAYNTRFKMPSGSSGGVMNMWYSFNIGPVHWISINTETDWPGAPEEKRGESKLYKCGGFGADGEYLAWLEEDLKKANASRAERPWIIASGHRPIVEIECMAELFDKYGLDVYFSGHKHYYERSYPTTFDGTIDEASVVNEHHYHAPNGRLYVIVGSAGCDEMDYIVDAYGHVTTALRASTPGYGVPAGTSVLGDKLHSNKISAGLLHASMDSVEWELIDATTGATLDTVKITK